MASTSKPAARTSGVQNVSRKPNIVEHPFRRHLEDSSMSKHTLAEFMGDPEPKTDAEKKNYNDFKFHLHELPGLKAVLREKCSSTDSTTENGGKLLYAMDFLIPRTGDFPSLPCADWSQVLVSPVPGQTLARDFWLAHSEGIHPPWISYSSFVPSPIVSHLMRNKKESPMGVKWVDGDKITNMEGAMHTFVTSIVLAWWHGEYSYDRGHRITLFGNKDGFQKARMVLVSNMVHQDFQNDEVMMKVAALAKEPTRCLKEFKVPSFKEKQNAKTRAAYDDSLRSYMVHHLTAEGELPSIQEACSSDEDAPLTREAAIDFLDSIVTTRGHNILEAVQGRYFWLNDPENSTTGLPLLSLEILVTTAFHQFAIEFDALDKICSHRGYHYTFNPPKIFARALGEDGRLMALVYAAGLCHYADTTKHTLMVSFETSDVDGGWLYFMRFAVARLTSRTDLLGDEKNPRMSTKSLRSVQEAIQVIHNNSNAFGQNIRAEKGFISLDAVVGQWSSTAANVLETRKDLLDHVMVRED